ncbi:PspC domain-containing protein [Lactococcus nasutitermitis]|uniref:PspC domain-containing protein n=1 Tax=Lactococcus nasutitermitis TaxID=1652957 RepID=A0ABV9JD52_9LACT|nr:PspC domain-containing protein [Lactococcus nasutitermitis]
MNSRQLTKSSDNRMVSGVIAGICEYFGWGSDVVTILRILYVILAFSSMGSLILIYFVASWIMPSAGRRNYRQDYQSSENKWEDKINRKAEKWNRKFEEKARKYEDKWSGSWNETRSNDSWNTSWKDSDNTGRKMKEAEPAEEKEEDWSDF